MQHPADNLLAGIIVVDPVAGEINVAGGGKIIIARGRHVPEGDIEFARPAAQQVGIERPVIGLVH